MSEQPLAEQQRDEQDRPGPRRIRRGVDVSAAASLALGLPWFLLSLGIVWSLSALPPEPWGWVVLVGWLLSGAAVLWRRSEDVLARVFSGLHRPTHDEQQRLDAAWDAVSQAAGIEGAKYSLWVEESEDVSAHATGVHTVAVTRRALETLPPRQLEAVLAHELGHHLGGHIWAAQLMYWYSIPYWLAVRLLWPLMMVIFWIRPVFFNIVSTICNFGWKFVRIFYGFNQETAMIMFMCTFFIRLFFAAVIIFMIAIMIYVIFWLALSALSVLIFVIILAWFSRVGEKYADRVAARLGYGPALIQVFQDFRAQGLDSARAELGLLDRLLVKQPSWADRILALEHYLQRNQA